MNQLQMTALAAFALVALSAGASAADLSRDEYQAGKDRIETEHATTSAKCDSVAAKEKDLCMAEATGKDKVARAELEAQHKHGPKSDYGVRIAKAEAGYGVAREKCDDLAGIGKAVCMKEAKAEMVRAKAYAKAKMKTAKANRTANEKSAAAHTKAKGQAAAARHEAAAENRDADYSVAKEKCGAFSGSAKGTCMDKARARYWPQS